MNTALYYESKVDGVHRSSSFDGATICRDHGRMKRSGKILLIMAFVLLACLVVLVWLISRPERRDVATVTDTSHGASFEVNVEKPRTDRAFFGILPTKVEAKLFGVGELRFDQASPGAKVGTVAPNHLELSADGWDLLIETDGGDGRITQGTRLMFPIEIAEKLWTLRCRPADRATGYLHANRRAGSDELDGRFLVELARCEDAATGKILDTEAGASPGHAWPSAPLTLSGSFAGLPHGQG
jgi:hypothetical protein